MSDSYIFELIKTGDKKAFERLFREYYSLLCSYANTVVHDIDEAENQVQEFLFQIWQKKEELPVDVNVRAYLIKSTYNRCLNFIKHKKIVEKHREISLSEQYTHQYEDNKIIIKELDEKIRCAIEKLPPERKKIFIMHRFEELKYKEIAEKLNISTKTVENQIGKALENLRRDLKDYLPVIIAIIIIIVLYK